MMRELPEWALDRITVVTDVQLGWADRLRVLTGGKLTVISGTDVECAPGRLYSTSRVSVPRRRWPWQQRMQFGQVTAPGPEGTRST
jgi:hypothetical protein